jgi:mono/diheme cytochrome c family protein
MYWRAGKKPTVRWAKVADVFIVILFAVVIVGVIVVGVWGYFVPAIVRINQFSVGQVLAVLFVLLSATFAVGFMLRGARETSTMTWGRMPVRSQLALIVSAVTVVFTMALMGYARSASRVHWHIYGVLEDTSPHAFSPALGHAGAMAALSTFLFFVMVGFLLWVVIRVLRHYAFSTQYFFLAPFVHWVVSLPEKAPEPAAAKVSKQSSPLWNALGTACGLLLLFTWLSYSVPQLVSLPPKKVAFDPMQIHTKGDLVEAGKGLFFGKAQCALCHTIEKTEHPRAPIMQGLGAKRTREYIYESMVEPKVVIHKQYAVQGPAKLFPAQMPKINKPPVGLSETEMLAVVAFVQSLGGQVTVEPEEVRALVPATTSEKANDGN